MYESRICPKHCTSYTTQDVIYNQTFGLWECCWGGGDLNCLDPSIESFFASPPHKLFESAESSASAAAATGQSTSTTATSPHTPGVQHTSADHNSDNGSNDSSSSSLATTIAVATVVPVVCVLLAVALFFWWKEKRRNKRLLSLSSSEFASKRHEAGVHTPTVEASAEQERRELSGKAMPHELGGQTFSELDTRR